tara:strand:- start:6 stop:593 length:588 start_codon:yes stop_codon:yes gene_type:complete
MIEFTRIYNQNVLDNLSLIINQEFENIPIRFDSTFRGNAFFQLTPQSDELIELRTDGAIREYGIQIRYYEKNYGIYTKRNKLDNRIKIIERLKELIRVNTASIVDILFFQTSDGKNLITSDSEIFNILRRPILVTTNDEFFITSDNEAFVVKPENLEYDWHNARLESVAYEQDEDNQRYLVGSVDFRCVVEEVYA